MSLISSSRTSRTSVSEDLEYTKDDIVKNRDAILAPVIPIVSAFEIFLLTSWFFDMAVPSSDFLAPAPSAESEFFSGTLPIVIIFGIPNIFGVFADIRAEAPSGAIPTPASCSARSKSSDIVGHEVVLLWVIPKTGVLSDEHCLTFKSFSSPPCFPVISLVIIIILDCFIISVIGDY